METINTLCGNKDIYTDILKWLQDFSYIGKISTDSCIIISGKTCIGKTYSIHKICSSLNYEIIAINNSNCVPMIALPHIDHLFDDLGVKLP